MGSNGNGLHLDTNGQPVYRAIDVSAAARNGGVVRAEVPAKSVQELLEEFEATGDQKPFEEIVRRYAGMVYNVCYQVSKNAHDAEDATQAVFLTLAVRSKTAQKIQYLGPWLQRVAQRLSLDVKRSKKRRSAREVKHHDLNVSRWEENNGPADLGMDELRGILRDEIDKLPAKYRMPLILHYFGGLKPDEMSKELGIKANTLGVRLHRARKMLGDNLQKRGVVVGGAMLSAALATLIPLYIQRTVSAFAAQPAAHFAVGHHLVTSEITSRVMGTLGTVNRAAMLGKIKAITAAVAIGVAAVAGGKQVVRQIRLHGFDLRRSFDLNRWLAPLFDRLRAPLQFSDAGDASDRLDRALNTPIVAAEPGDFSDAARGDNRIDSFGDGMSQSSAIFASAGNESPVRSFDRVPFAAAPAKIDRPAALLQPARLSAAQTAAAVATPAPPQVFNIVAAAPVRAAAPAQTVSQQFDAAVGSFRLNSGAIDRSTITLDSRSAALESFHITGGSLRAERLTIADTGRATFRQSGGTVTTDTLAVASAAGSTGAYRLEAGELQSNVERIGVAGNATFDQSGGVNRAAEIALAQSAGSQANYTIHAGNVFTNDLRVGVAGSGNYNQAGGVTTVRSTTPAGGVRIAETPHSSGSVNVSGGALDADKVFVAINGDGQYNIAAGQTLANKIILASGSQGRASLSATGGEIVFNNPRGAGNLGGASITSPAGALAVVASSSVGNAFVVGAGGDAQVELGGRNHSVSIREGSTDSSTPVIIGASRGSDSAVSGWGDVSLHGALFQNGKLIADGRGSQRVLDFSSFSRVENTVENDADETNGYFARRNGELRLPAINVTGDGQYNWGESAADAVPDLVNSVRLGLHDVKSPGQANVALLAPDSPPAAAPAGELFVGLWQLQRDGAQSATTDLLIRYDEQTVQQLGLSEKALSLWAFDGEWTMIAPADLVLDTQRNLIGGTVAGDFSLFAVSLSTLSPEAGGGFVSVGNAALSAECTAFIDGIGDTTVAALPRGDGVVPEPMLLAPLAAAMLLLRRQRRTPL